MPASPAELAARYNAEGIDELVVLDVTATLEGRGALARHDPRRLQDGSSSRSRSAAGSDRSTMRER